MNKLDKKRPGTSQTSERFRPNFAPSSFALQQSIRLVYMLRALIPSPKPRNQGNEGQPRCTVSHTDRAHARQRRHNTTASPRLRRGAGRCCCRAAATAAAAAAAVLLLCCCCATAASRSAMHRGAQSVTTDCFSFCILWNARRSK